MGNCLKTRLKENIQNENLPIFNKLVINVSAGAEILFYRVGGTGVTIQVENGVLKNYDKTYETDRWEFNYGDMALYLVMNGDGKIVIENYYNLTNFHVNDYQMYNRFSGVDLNNLKFNTLLTNLAGNFTGDISNIAKNTNLVLLQGISYEGDFVEFTKALANNQKSTGTIRIINGHCTFNQKDIPLEFRNHLIDLKWESANKIYLEYNTYILTAGYTPTEVAANKAGTGTVDWTGKNVTRSEDLE